MQWYDNTVSALEPGKTYTRSALMDCMKKNNPSLSRNSFQWAVGSMVQSGKLVRTGFDEYKLPGDLQRPIYLPDYTDSAKALMEQIAEKYPCSQFTVFETSLMNEFLNHLIAQNTIFIQVEKETSIFVFRFLQEEGYQNLMYKPIRKDFNLYWSKDSIIVTDMVSESPLLRDSPHSISLEKMLVDMYCDKLISSTFSKAEYASVVEQATSKYMVERPKLLRYARRRNKEAEIKVFFNGAKYRD